jgi:predicted XRE-type DNA-binding protein
VKAKTYSKIEDFGKDLGLSYEQVEIAKLKTKLKDKIRKQVDMLGLNVSEVAQMSGLARSAVSGIINGSLQSVSIERLLKLAFALELSVDLKFSKVA